MHSQARKKCRFCRVSARYLLEIKVNSICLFVCWLHNALFLTFCKPQICAFCSKEDKASQGNKRCLHICAVCSWAAKKHSWEASQSHSEAWSVFFLEGCCWKLLLKHFQWGSFFQLDIFLPETFQGTIIFFLQNTGWPETKYSSQTSDYLISKFCSAASLEF